MEHPNMRLRLRGRSGMSGGGPDKEHGCSYRTGSTHCYRRRLIAYRVTHHPADLAHEESARAVNRTRPATFERRAANH